MKCKVIREFRRAVEGSVYGELLAVGLVVDIDIAMAEGLAREGYIGPPPLEEHLQDLADKLRADRSSESRSGEGDGQGDNAGEGDDQGGGNADDEGDGESGEGEGADDDGASAPEPVAEPVAAPVEAPVEAPAKASKVSKPKSGGKK